MGIKEQAAKWLSSPSQEYSGELVLSESSSRTLAGKKDIIDPSTPIGVKITPEITRVAKVSLELAYVSDPNVFNAINKTVQLIMSAGYNLVGNEDDVAFFTEFFQKIGSRGGELEWDELFSSIFKHQMIFGDSWVELIPSKRVKNRIVDLDLLDSKRMDYAKDGFNHIVLNSNGNPVGYVQTVPYGYEIQEKVSTPKEVSLGADQSFFPPEKIGHFKLYTVGDGFYPVGLIEPSYDSVRRKAHLESAHANSFKKNGFPRILVTAGDETHHVTEAQLRKALTNIKDLDNLGVIGVQEWVKVTMLEPKGFEALLPHLNYYIEQITTGMGLPRALMTGSGGEANRRTLERQEALTKMTLKDIISRTIKVLEKQVIAPVAKSNGKGLVKIVWGEMLTEVLDDRARRLGIYAKNRLITPDQKLEAQIRADEGLPEAVPDERRKDQPEQGK